jgi:hypothetical protein
MAPAQPVPNFAMSIPNSALEASHICGLKNNFHSASFVTEKDMCAYAQMMKEATKRGLKFLGRAQRSDGAGLPLRFDNQQAQDEENPMRGTT